MCVLNLTGISLEILATAKNIPLQTDETRCELMILILSPGKSDYRRSGLGQLALSGLRVYQDLAGLGLYLRCATAFRMDSVLKLAIKKLVALLVRTKGSAAPSLTEELRSVRNTSDYLADAIKAAPGGQLNPGDLEKLKAFGANLEDLKDKVKEIKTN